MRRSVGHSLTVLLRSVGVGSVLPVVLIHVSTWDSSFVPDIRVACPLISGVGVQLSKSKGIGGGALGCSANTVPSNPFDSTL